MSRNHLIISTCSLLFHDQDQVPLPRYANYTQIPFIGAEREISLDNILFLQEQRHEGCSDNHGDEESYCRRRIDIDAQTAIYVVRLSL